MALRQKGKSGGVERYGCGFGTEMASAVGEDRGWGMSEAVPAQVRGATSWPLAPSVYTVVYIGHGYVSIWTAGMDGQYVNA